jgi:hypothetical protein
MQTIAAFDLGIKNLSYCVATFDASGSLLAVNRWANLNLLADGADSQSQTRCACGGPASWQDCPAAKLLCKKCAKKSAKPALENLESKSVSAWREWGLAHGIPNAKTLTKKALEAKAGETRLMPYKAPKAKGVSLQAILVGMEKCLTAELSSLVAASRIRIENQPSEFAPHMKSIQIMLFTLLDHRIRTEYGWTGTIEFAHASVKTRGIAGTGKDAKRSRKQAAITKVSELLTKAGSTELAWWNAQAKQDDLADALLMCLDAV